MTEVAGLLAHTYEIFEQKKRKDLHGSTMYVTLYPCNECAKAIIQSGIKKVIFLDNKYKNSENNIAARFLFKVAGIETVQYTKSSREVSLSL